MTVLSQFRCQWKAHNVTVHTFVRCVEFTCTYDFKNNSWRKIIWLYIFNVSLHNLTHIFLFLQAGVLFLSLSGDPKSAGMTSNQKVTASVPLTSKGMVLCWIALELNKSKIYFECANFNILLNLSLPCHTTLFSLINGFSICCQPSTFEFFYKHCHTLYKDCIFILFRF